MDNIQKIIKHFFQAFDDADYATMQNLLAKNLKSYITNAEGGVNLLEGSEALMQGIKNLDIGNVTHSITVPQITTIKPTQAMVMFEIKAERKGKKLHNHAAYLMDFDSDHKICKIHMVEALPAYSDEFWK